MRLDEEQTLSRVVLVLLIAMLPLGCRSLFFPPGYPDEARSPAFTTTQAIILEEARTDYDFGPERPAVDRVDRSFPGPTVPDSMAPDMSMAMATLKAGRTRPPRRIIARITSNRDYPLMGIHEGANYIWRDTWDTTTVAAATWINRVTSAKRGEPDHQLVRDPRLDQFPPVVTQHTPSILKLTVNSIAFEACLDDPACPSGHCGYY
jgi:hypothetical protein